MKAALAISVLALAAGTAQAADKPVLTVYTYSSFIAEWGPGPKLEAAFESACGCDLQWVGVEDGVALLSRLKLEGATTEADVVVGLDTNLTAEAAATGLFADSGVDPAALTNLPVAWSDPVFVPYDWSYFAFVYDKAKVPNPPTSLRGLVYDSDIELTIQDPRTSTPGLGLLLWMKQVFGDEAPAAWAALEPRIVTVTPGWSESYGLFRSGEVPMTLSYTTSPAYHIIAEQDDSVAAAIFDEGHYLQVEVAGRIAGSDQPALAQSFLAFLATPEAQAAIPETNWMYPAVKPATPLPDAFADPVPAGNALLYPAETVAANRAAWIDEWLAAMAP